MPLKEVFLYINTCYPIHHRQLAQLNPAAEAPQSKPADSNL